MLDKLIEQLGGQQLQVVRRVAPCSRLSSKSSRMSSARRANPYSACTAGRCSGASSRVARKKVWPCSAFSQPAPFVGVPQRGVVHACGVELGAIMSAHLRCVVGDPPVDGPGDPVGGQPSGHQGGRHPDARHRRRAGQHHVVDAANGVGRPERPGLAEGVRQRERGARHHALPRPVRGVDDVQQFGVDAQLRQPVGDGGEHAVGVGGADAHPSRRCPAPGWAQVPARRADRGRRAPTSDRPPSAGSPAGTGRSSRDRRR